jgi:hypothetical protein
VLLTATVSFIVDDLPLKIALRNGQNCDEKSWLGGFAWRFSFAWRLSLAPIPSSLAVPHAVFWQ